jgi:endonuclease YncB( thermonuclease family)
MYPVRVACAGCPENPFEKPQALPRSTITTFDPATIDFKADGDTIETKPDEGWSWDELDLVDERAGGASKTQRDALMLLAVLMQHSSNKAINQRIVCVDPPKCSQTVMMISDVGKTFGRASAFNKDRISSVNFSEWSQQPVWNTDHGCIGDLPHSWSGTMHDPQVGEAGRKFLADLLVQLTDQQLHDIFEVARFTERDPSATVDDWVRVFKHKRDEIVNRHCDR